MKDTLIGKRKQEKSESSHESEPKHKKLKLKEDAHVKKPVSDEDEDIATNELEEVTKAERKTLEHRAKANRVNESSKENKKATDNENGQEESEIKNGEDGVDHPVSAVKGTAINAFFSTKKFEALPVNDCIKDALAASKYETMTHIQAKTIPYLLKGRDVLGAAKTGSGKTLAFMIPAVETLMKANFTQKNGTGVIVITPTRELAQQIYDVAKDLMQFTNKTLGLIIGGANRKMEGIKLVRGVNVIIATPGRLLDHLQNTKGFLFRNLINLIIDEADAILKQGFEQDMTEILKILPKERQTVLFSATQTKKVEDLARLSLKSPIYIGVDDQDEAATVGGLEQGYVVCEEDKRFLLLFTFLKKNISKKVMVFFSSCNSVKFHAELLNFVDVKVWDIHGKHKQQKRTSTFYEFCNAASGVLLCTDVAARGLDIPAVDWIVQYDPPDDTKEYIHRVGRTCRGTQSSGKALLFLLPSEKGYLKYLRQAKVSLNEYEFPDSKLANIQSQFDKLIERNYYLNCSARDGFRSYLQSYASHSMKEIFDVNSIDLQKAARSFGFLVPPKVTLNAKVSGKTVRKNKMRFLEKNDRSMLYKDKDRSLLKKSTGGRQFAR